MPGELGEVRIRAVKLLLRAEEDEEFRTFLQENTAAALEEYNLSAEDIAALNKNPGIMGISPQEPCRDTTCWVSWCGPTCIITWEMPAVIHKPYSEAEGG